LEVYFGSHGLVNNEFIPEGRRVNKQVCVELFSLFRDTVRIKRPEKWAPNSWPLLHDNAAVHQPLVAKEYLAKHKVTASEHPPHSPDFSCFRDSEMFWKDNDSREPRKSLQKGLTEVFDKRFPEILRKTSRALAEVCHSPREVL
jgi:hypothetical protein